MDIFIYVVAALAVAIAYACGKVDGECLACRNPKSKCNKE